MRSAKYGVFTSALLFTLSVTGFASPRVHRGPTSPRLLKTRTASSKPKSSSVRSIEPERALQIQTALIKAGYLTGSPSGVWDSQSEIAMQKLQADNGWQTKLVPDSRAIIRLGLGPNASTDLSANSSAEIQPNVMGSTPEPAALPANGH